MELRMIVDMEKFEILAKLRGWRSKYSDLAIATGMSRSYVRRVLIGQEELTMLFFLRFVKVAGVSKDRPSEWGSLFKIVDAATKHEMSLNYPKLRGHIPYKKMSLSAEFRKQDNPHVETR